jgi:cytidine deaminase
MGKLNKIQAEYIQHTYAELDDSLRELISKAKEATGQAYAPYSNFKVGAAVLLDDGSIHVGSNQENAAFPSGLCAERVLLNYVHSNFPDLKPLAMAITARNSDGFTEEPVTPCGACLQVMGELEKSWDIELPVFLSGEMGVIEVKGVHNFLPFFFNGTLLK